MTLQIAQALYEKHKVLTYPRTDSRYLPEDHLATAKSVMGNFHDPTLAPHAEKALRQGWVRPNKRIFDNAKVSDHFAIVPTGTAPKNLDEREQKIFDLVARRFIAVFYPAAQFEVTTRSPQSKGRSSRQTEKSSSIPVGSQFMGGRLKAKAKMTNPSFRSVRVSPLGMRRSRSRKPDQSHRRVSLKRRCSQRWKERANSWMTRSFAKAMSERGLGHAGDPRADHRRVALRRLPHSPGTRPHRDGEGLSLITLLRELRAEALTKPELTGEWEFKLRQIQRGQLSRPAFMEEIRQLTTELVGKVRSGMGHEVHGNFKPIEVKCPKCGGGPFRESFKAYECVNPSAN
jgi:DNA topoisomerase-3